MTDRPYSEAQLVDAFLATSASGSEGVVLREFETLAGIPDIVFVRGLRQGTDLLVELAEASGLTNGLANVVTCLSRSRPHRKEYIVSRTGLGYTYVQRILSELKRRDLIESTITGSVVLASGYEPPRIGFTAIEFKLSDWRRALSQAVRHRSFAEKALVVMPTSCEDTLFGVADTFRAYGVGSAVFDPGSSGLSYVVRPRSRRPGSRRVFLDAVGRVSSALAPGEPDLGAAAERAQSRMVESANAFREGASR